MVKWQIVVLVAAVVGGFAPLKRDQQPSEASVRDVENRWSEAFVSGDAAYLEELLDAAYVSVGANGKTRPKQEIVELARRYAAKHPGEHATPLSETSTIRVVGNAAVVMHRNPGDTSVDVFYFRNGRWHAWYSQHTRLER